MFSRFGNAPDSPDTPRREDAGHQTRVFFQAILASVLTVGFMAIYDAVVAPGPSIRVHALTYKADPEPAIRQDRTVSATGPLVAIWSARIEVRNQHGGVEEVCSGEGHWRYTSGRVKPLIGLDRWVGEVGCMDRLHEQPERPYRACASYEWGVGRITSRCSGWFSPPRVAAKDSPP